MATESFELPALDNSFGALLIGCIIGAALWGVGTLQLYWYYSNYPKDHPCLKLLTALVWIFDTTQQALIGHVVYFYLVKNYFNPLILDHYVWSLNIQSEFEALTSFAVQGFFVYRIGRLSKWNYWYTGSAAILTLAKFGLGTAYVIQGVPLHSITLAFSKLHNTSEAINSLAVATDVTIAAILTWLLYRSRTGFDRTNSLINKLIVYTVNTSAITSVCSVVTLITAKTMPTNFVYGSFYFLTARLYVNSMLATLNARRSILSNEGTDIDLKQIKISQQTETDKNTPFSSRTALGSGSGVHFKTTSGTITSAIETSFKPYSVEEEEAYGKANLKWQESTGISRV